jgi:hypothetical protein
VFTQDSETTEHIEIRPFATVPAKVSVSLGRTVNLGNYESAKVNVLFELPCYREEVLSIYPKLVDEVSKRLDREVAKIGKQTGRKVDVDIEGIL